MEAGALAGAGASAGAGAFAGAGASAGAGAFTGLGAEPESDVPAPDESVPLFEVESVLLLGSGEVTAAGAGEVVGVVVVVAGVEVLLLQPARSTIKPLAAIKQGLWNLMVATTAQRVRRCARVVLLGSAGALPLVGCVFVVSCAPLW